MASSYQKQLKLLHPEIDKKDPEKSNLASIAKPTLQTLRAELIFEIAKSLELDGLAKLRRTCQMLNLVLTPALYKRGGRKPYEALLYGRSTYGFTSLSPSDKDEYYSMWRAVAGNCDLNASLDTGRVWIVHWIITILIDIGVEECIVNVLQIIIFAGKVDVDKRDLGWLDSMGVNKGRQSMLEQLAREFGFMKFQSPKTRVRQGNAVIGIEILLSHGADPTIPARHASKESRGRESESMVLTIARSHRFAASTVDLILQSHREAQKSEQRKQMAAGMTGTDGPSGICKLLDVNVVTPDGNNALHLLCSNSDVNLDSLHLLLEYGVGPTHYNKFGQTPLHVLGMNESPVVWKFAAAAQNLLQAIPPTKYRLVLAETNAIATPAGAAASHGRMSILYGLLAQFEERLLDKGKD